MLGDFLALQPTPTVVIIFIDHMNAHRVHEYCNMAIGGLRGKLLCGDAELLSPDGKMSCE